MRLCWRLLGLVAALAGCRQLLGIEERPVERGDAGDDAATCASPLSAAVSSLCATCLRRSCCPDLDACHDDPECIECAQGRDSCISPPASYVGLETCFESSCAKDCKLELPGPPPVEGTLLCDTGSVQVLYGECFHLEDFFGHAHCNPISSVPCEPEEVCAFDVAGYVADCRVGAHHGDCNSPCGPLKGGCGPGLVCVATGAKATEGICGRWCCDGDCGSGVCVPVLDGGAGVCFEK